MNPRRVIMELPYGSDDPAIVAENVLYGRLCMFDCLKRGDAPMASHLLYTQEGVLNDQVPEERRLGIEAGLAWGPVASATVVYYDRGISPGMIIGIKRAYTEGRDVEYRTLRPIPATADVTTLAEWVEGRQPLILGLPGMAPDGFWGCKRRPRCAAACGRFNVCGKNQLELAREPQSSMDHQV